jgi:hypothetical protein
MTSCVSLNTFHAAVCYLLQYQQNKRKSQRVSVVKTSAYIDFSNNFYSEIILNSYVGRRGRDRLVVRFPTTS